MTAAEYLVALREAIEQRGGRLTIKRGPDACMFYLETLDPETKAVLEGAAADLGFEIVKMGQSGYLVVTAGDE